MNWLTSTLILGFFVALASTFDDNLYLTAFFGKVNYTFRPQNIIIGEFLGFTVLVIASLPGIFWWFNLASSLDGLARFITNSNWN